MNKGKYVFAQLTDFLPQRVFDGFVAKYSGNIRQALYMLEPVALYGFRTTYQSG